MEWRALEEHVRVAVAQEPGPFGENAFEWDYSRYARGLGLTGEPAADDLPHRGCAVLALPPARWDVAEEKYRTWAEAHGWEVWRIGARPTVAAPDPVVYALGARMSGEMFARAANPVVPALGRRPRSEGLSFPLTPGERWLIATDRVRRRARAEIAMHGLVLFVDEAEWLTPAALAVLVYLLDAHRAWLARMLSRPARAYVVFATAPQHEGSVVRMLKRFGLAGHAPVARERRKGASGAAPMALRDIEEEHLFGALAAAPAALAEEDVRVLFGASAIDRCRALAERGLLRVRAEAGQTCYLPHPEVPAGLATPSPRALRAIDGRYRQLARRGYEHLTLARAALSLELGDPLRAVAAVARTPYTGGALLPLRVFEALDATLDRARARLRADHAAAWFSLAAHHRTYDHAREVADAVTDRELRTWKEACRVVEMVLCAGRTHLDSCLPPDFWPRLKSQSLVGPFMDATCVVGEMFWRKRHLDVAAIRQRYEFACDCFARWERPRSTWFERLERIVHLTTYRAALHVGVPSKVLSLARGVDAVPQETLRSFLRRNQLPAYVAAAPLFAEAAMGYVCPPRSFDTRDRFVGVMLTGTTGQPEDLSVSTNNTLTHLQMHGHRLLARDLIDDVFLLAPRRVHPDDRQTLGRFLLSATAGREVLVGVSSLCPASARDADGNSMAANIRMAAGDFVGARDSVAAGLASKPRWPLSAGTLIALEIILARKALDRRRLASATDMIERNRALLTADLCEYLAAFLDGSRAVLAGDFEEAARRFLAAQRVLVGTYVWATVLKTEAVQSAKCARLASRLIESCSGHGHCIWRAIRAFCRGPGWDFARPSLSARAALCLDHLWWVLEACSRAAVDKEELLRVAFFLKDTVDGVFRPLGREFLDLMAEWAPTCFARLHAALEERVGGLDLATPDQRSMRAALLTIEETWKRSHMVAIDDRCGEVVIRERGSRSSQAKRVMQVWYDDATAYAQLHEADGKVRLGEFSRIAYGYIGRTGGKPVATTLDFHVTPLDRGAFEVYVDAGVTPVRATSAKASARRRGPVAMFQGKSVAAQRVRGMIETASKCRYPVLVLGETGVGKDVVARCIHAGSAWRGQGIVVAECAGIAESLLESELFGHEKGAFTGAHARHEGFFARANGSTLLLDELDSMSARLQAMLLRVVESGEYRPVGAHAARKSEFRLISAALPRLPALVEGGQFRKDLLYRISTLRIEIPPLREREEDSAEIGVAHARTLGFHLTPGALRTIAQYDWPGNVRQLRHGIQAASLHARDGRIGEAAIGDVIAAYGDARATDSKDVRGLDAAWGRALKTIERMGRFGAWDFARAAGLSRRSAQRYVVQLLGDGRILRVGAGRTTRYTIRG